MIGELFRRIEAWFFRWSNRNRSSESLVSRPPLKYAKTPKTRLLTYIQILNLLKSRADRLGSRTIADEGLAVLRSSDLRYGIRLQALWNLANTYEWRCPA